MNTHKHKLVICSLKRGQYLVNLLTMANGDLDSTWNDGDNINAAIEFGALYSEDDLRALAESQGPDWEVQPADLFEPHPLDRYSARDRAIGKRITHSFGEWLAKCERSDAWHDGDYDPTLANVKAFIDDYADWREESAHE